MANADYEDSPENGLPVFLYVFSLNGRFWRFASCAQDVMTVDGHVWTATAISHSGVSQTGEANTDALTIECPTQIAPVQLYMLSPPTNPVSVRIFQKDAVDNQVVAQYVGEVSQVNFPEPGKATITCETLSVSMRREGLRLGWQRSCPYAVYDPVNCKVHKASYGIPVTITEVDGFDIVVAYSGGLLGVYGGGFFEWLHPVKGLEFLGIEAQDGKRLKVFGTTADLYPGLQITLYRGCDGTPDACDSFGNYLNYGGVPDMPGKSPFDGDPVF